ncbi:MAG TPA: biotin/lipoyl-binding protein, partial [Planctomycetaceae bacterium]|nr:biotin/lipoyl-binding protein [Planctomycetaceae bacterium]
MSAQIEQETLRSDPPVGGARAALPSPLSDKVRSLRITTPPPQTKSGSLVPWFLCLVLAASTGYFAFSLYGPNRPGGEAVPAKTPQTASAGATSTAPRAVADSGGVALESKGYIVPAHQILVSPKVSGMVKYLRVQKPDLPPEEGVPLEEGMRVQKGDILAQLESTDYEADVARARAMLASSQQKLATELKNVPNEIE